MQPLGAILLGVATMVVGQAPAPEQPSAIDAALDRYDGLTHESQARWARELLVRLDRAGGLVLADAEAARLRERIDKFARLLDRGYRPPPSSLRNLLVELHEQEQQAVERLARNYRLQVYRTFRQQEDVYRARRDAWEEVEAAWQSVGRTPERQPQLIDWLVVATHRSTPGTIGRLPGVPDFRPQIGVPPKWPGRVATGGRRPGPSLPESILRPDNAPRHPDTAPDLAAPYREASPQDPPFGDWLVAAPVNPAAARPGVESATRLGGPRRSPDRRSEGAVAPGDWAWPRMAGPKPLPPQNPAHLVADPAAEPASRSAEVPIELPRSPQPEPSPPDWLLAQPSSRAPRRGSSETALSGTAPAGPPVRRGLRPPVATAGDDPLPEPLVAARFPHGGPWPDFPAEPLTDSPGDSAAAAVPTPGPAGPGGQGVAPPDVQVNLNELSAGIAGANLALRALEAELDNSEARSSARRLESLLRRLEVLVLRHDDLVLFCELIGPQERQQVGRLDSPRAIIPRLANKTFALRSHVESDDYNGTPADREFELELLGEVSRRLAKLAERP